MKEQFGDRLEAESCSSSGRIRGASPFMRRRGAEETERERLTLTRSLFDSLTVEQKLSNDLKAPTEEGDE